MIQYKKDIENIAIINLDMDGRQGNIINHKLYKALEPVLDHLIAEKEKGLLRGVIFTSSQKTFLTGGDLEYLYETNSPEELYEYSQEIQNFFRKLEAPGIPVVAAMNGSCLGLGFEMALACHYRIAVDDNTIQLGNPEIELGLMPGGGATIRLLWMLGIENAYNVLTKQKKFNPSEALEKGVIDQIVPRPEGLIFAATQWIKQQTTKSRPWDMKAGQAPVSKDKLRETLKTVQYLTASLVSSIYANFPAHLSILNTLAEGIKLDFDTACKIESQHFSELVLKQDTKNMLKTFWFDLNNIKNGEMRPEGYGKFRARKVGIVGAGNMGTGIALSCLINGLEVVMKDVSEAIVLSGKKIVFTKLDEMQEARKISTAMCEKAKAIFVATVDIEQFDKCDLIVEAVFENKNLKIKVAKELDQYVDEYSFFGTNTVSIPISDLGAVFKFPKNYIGLHFFSPVEKVHMCEIVRGKQTSSETIARAFDFVKQIKKIPVLVKDNWGFFAARVQNTYILEGIQMLQEGFSAASIENLGRQAGMTRAPLALADSLSLNLVLRYEEQAAKHYGPKYIPHPAVSAINKMIEDVDRPGRPTKRGFYDYDENSAKRNLLWNNLESVFPTTQVVFDFNEPKERLLIVQVLEVLWCLHEGVVQSVAEANLGSIYGWGFPAFKGGAVQYITDYGKKEFIARCKHYETQHGPRFQVPKIIHKLLPE